MLKRHYEFNKILNPAIKANIDKQRVIKCTDARNLPCEENTATYKMTIKINDKSNYFKTIILPINRAA